jgi:hypothetical protein
MAAGRMAQWDEAARLWDTVIGFGPKLGLTAVHGFARIMLARAYQAAGRSADARKTYEDAFLIWKDADPDMPLLNEARREYQRLSS